VIELLRRVFFHFHESDIVAHLLCGSMYNNSTFLCGSTFVFFETDRVKLNHVQGLNVCICHFYEATQVLCFSSLIKKASRNLCPGIAHLLQCLA
jgi:hypothetical protein